MTIASEITNYANGLSDAYDAVNDMQGLIPQDKNMNNLDTAIRTIPQNLGPTYTAGNGIVIDANDEISIDDTVVAELSDLPTKTSELQNDGSDGTSTYVEADDLATVATSGDYTDLINTPTIPTVNDATLTITQNGTSAGTFTANSSTDTTIALTDTTYSDFTGATSLADGAAGLVPKPLAGDETKFLSGNGQWTTVSQYNLPIASANDLGGIKVGSNLSIDSGTGVLSATDTTYSDFTGATTQQAGAAGLVPAPTTSDPEKYLKGDGTWDTPTGTTYSAGTNIQISAGNVISATDTTYSDFTGSTASADGTSGLVPQPLIADKDKFLKGDGTWSTTPTKLVEMSYGESNAWQKFIDAYDAGAIVYCRASSNANPATGSQTRKAFMAYVNNATTPTEVEFQYVRSVSSKTSSQPVDQVFVYKLTSSGGGTWTVQTRDMAPKLAAGTNTSVSYSNGTYTVSATDTTYSNMTGATSGTAGAAGLVPAPAAGDQDKVLSGAGTWVTQSGGGSTYTAGNHIDITNDVISAEGYIWGDDAAPASTPASTITSAMIVDGTIQATDIATGVVPIITMTDTDPGEGSPLAANNFIAVYGDDPSNMNYSLNETKTGATWIDGSPIYKKTINFGALPNATSKRVAHGISNLDLVIKTEGYSKDSYNVQRGVPYTHMGSSLGGSVMDIESSDIVIYTDSDRSGLTAYITLYYTKSS